MLEQLMQQLGQNGMQSPAPFGRAQRNMGDASGALRRTERGRALSEQDQAMQELRQGAETMARNLMQQGPGTRATTVAMARRAATTEIRWAVVPSRGEDLVPSATCCRAKRPREGPPHPRVPPQPRNDGTMQKLERDTSTPAAGLY